MNAFYVEFCGFQERLNRRPLLLVNDPVTGNTISVDTDGIGLQEAIAASVERSRAQWIARAEEETGGTHFRCPACGSWLIEIFDSIDRRADLPIRWVKCRRCEKEG